MFDDATRSQLLALFARLTHPVTLVTWLDGTPASRDLRALVEAVSALSGQVVWRDGEEGAADSPRRPLLAVGRGLDPARVRFAGLPTGHEFTSLVLAIAQAGGVPPRFSEAEVARIEAISAPLKLATFVSLACHNCPDVVQALNAMAAINPLIQHEMVDGGLFPAELEARGLLGVPAVVMGEALVSSGRQSVSELLAALERAGVAFGGARQAAEGASGRTGCGARRPPGRREETFDLLVVGGGPAGAAAAIYAARKGIRTGLVAERFGGQVQDTLGIENLIAVAHTEGPRLAGGLEAQVRAQGVEVMTGVRVEDLEEGADGRRAVRLADGSRLSARALVLAPGARWRELGVPGEQTYRGRGVAWCPHCDGPLFKGRAIAVIGGGNSGVEAAIDLAGVAAHVTLVESGPQLKADAVLVERLAGLRNVKVLLSARTTGILGDGQRVTGLGWEDRETGEQRELGVAGVFVQIGLTPNTGWLAGQMDLNRAGEIVVDDRGATSLPGVFAAGDATTTPYKQIVIAMGDGARASLGAFEWLMRQPAEANAAA
jgi:alkyl hydroperoxide reductase subunit F